MRASVFADDFFAIVVPDEYDALLACNRKTEAIVAMREMWKRDGKRRGRIGEGGVAGVGDGAVLRIARARLENDS